MQRFFTLHYFTFSLQIFTIFPFFTDYGTPCRSELINIPDILPVLALPLYFIIRNSGTGQPYIAINQAITQVHDNPLQPLIRYRTMPPRRPALRISDPPADFPSRTITMDGRIYHLVGAGFHYDKAGRRAYYDIVKNSRGEYKEYSHEELLRISKPVFPITPAP